MNKTILLVGAMRNNFDQYTYTTSFARALRKLGNHVETLNSREKFLPKNIERFIRINDYLFNKKLITQVKRIKPDVLFAVKADRIFISTLKIIKKINERLAS